MKIAFVCFCVVLVMAGCASVVKVPPYPSHEAWTSDVIELGTVTADSGSWPLSLNSLPPDLTFHAALRAKAASQFNVPEDEIILGEVTVEVMAEMVGTIRSWKATARAGRISADRANEGSPAARLTALKRLLDEGIISQEDFDARKAEILKEL